jgi:hypothetical protein
LCKYATVLATGEPRWGVNKVTTETIKKKIGNICGHITFNNINADPRVLNGEGHVKGRLERILRGIDRNVPYEKRERRGMTNDILKRMVLELRNVDDIKQDDKVMLTAALVMGQVGLLRPSEYLAPTSKTTTCKHDPIRGTMERKDITIMNDSHDVPMAIRVFIKRSKTNNHGEYLTPMMRVSDHTVCPVTTMRAYLRLPGININGPLFVYRDGSFLTLKGIDRLIKSLASRCNLGTTGWSSYSMRIGGAMSLANAGADATYVKKVGRWKSDTYLRYVQDFSLSVHADMAEKRSKTKPMNELDEVVCEASSS